MSNLGVEEQIAAMEVKAEIGDESYKKDVWGGKERDKVVSK